MHAQIRARGSRTAGRTLIAVLLAATCAIPAAAAPAPARALEYPADCHRSPDPVATANELMSNWYRLAPHPVVQLPANPTWAENPLHDANWQFQLHSLRFVLDLLEASALTGNTAYADRGMFLLRDWYQDNPRSSPPSAYSWNDHATALRAIVYACAAQVTPMSAWLKKALLLHGQTLASPTFYVAHGNHALNQALGLLEVGRALGRSDWTTLARDRINALVLESIDSQGVANEQSVGYEVYDYQRYREAERRLIAAGLEPGPGFQRVRLMPGFIAAATLPDGTDESIGDTDADPAPVLPDVPPPPTVAVYAAGYLFARSGRGEARGPADETFLSARWGPGRRLHGHPDGSSLTLYAWGSRLIVDPGRYAYGGGSIRRFMTSRRAHNVVTVDGVAWNSAASTALASETTTGALVDIRLKSTGYKGVTARRRITWSRNLDYILVEDRLTSASRHTYRQLWHLVEDARPAVSGSTVRTDRQAGNVLISQLVGSPAVHIVKGATNPVQGWISYRYGAKVAAPVVEAIRTGTDVRYLTLIVPAKGQPLVSVSDLRLSADGYQVTITVDGHAERVVASGSAVSITSLDHWLGMIHRLRMP